MRQMVPSQDCGAVFPAFKDVQQISAGTRCGSEWSTMHIVRWRFISERDSLDSSTRTLQITKNKAKQSKTLSCVQYVHDECDFVTCHERFRMSIPCSDAICTSRLTAVTMMNQRSMVV